MRHKYYDKVKKEFFSTSNAEKYVEGIEYLISDKAVREAELLDREQYVDNGLASESPVAAVVVSDDENLASPHTEYSSVIEDLLAVAYLLHEKFIANFFQIYKTDNPELLGKFATAYAKLLEHFSSLDDESKDDATFKQIILGLLNAIVQRDSSKQLALMLAAKLVECDLSSEFCLTVLTQANMAESESQEKIMTILGKLYNKDSVWNKASNTPSMAFSVTPNTPQTMAAMMYQEATKHCSRHAHNANISFLFYMQSCWYRAGNLHGCHFIDKCLPASVGALTLYPAKISEWRWMLKTLEAYPPDSMQQRWRSRIIQNINTQYNNSPELLDRLGVNRISRWCSLTWLFNGCRSHESLEVYESKPVIKGRQFVLQA